MEIVMAGKEEPTQDSEHCWEGFREIDRAISEDRLTSYTWRKTWADPWGRLKLILIFVGLIAFVAFVVVHDAIL